MDKMSINMKKAAAAIFILLFIVLPSFRVNARSALGERNTLNLWEASDGTLIQSIETEEYIWRAALNSDGTVIAAVHEDGMLASYDAQSGEVLHTRVFTSTGDARFTNIRPGFLPREVFVIQGRQFWLWDFVADEILLEGTTPQQITDIVLRPDGDVFLVETRQEQTQSIIIFSRETGTTLATTGGLPLIWNIEWSLDSTRIAVAHRNGINVFDPETGANLLELPFDYLDVYSTASWSPDGNSLLALVVPYPNEEDTEILLIDSDGLETQSSIPLNERAFSASWSADSRQILTAQYRSDGVSAYDVETGDLVRSYSGGDTVAGFLTAGWGFNDALIVGQAAMTASGGEYVVWQAETGKVVHDAQFGHQLLHMVWNDAKSGVLFTVWPSSTADVIDMTQLDAPRYTLSHEDTLKGAAWSADGSRILTWTGQDRG